MTQVVSDYAGATREGDEAYGIPQPEQFRDVASEASFRRWDARRPPVTHNIEGWSSPRRGADPLWRAATAMAVLSLLVPVLVAGILGASLLSASSGPLPPLRPGIDAQITRAYDISGAEIATLHRFDTSLPVAREDIPPVLRQAVVAAEDQRFYEHKGVDSRGILRALWADVRGGGYRQGASTITQQYVRLAYTGDRRTLSRKVEEAVLAGRVEAALEKDEILYLYLSRAYFGAGNYGVGAAAESYFQKPVRDLTLSEAALLAGLLPSPTRYEPRSNPTGAETRRTAVLGQMADQGRITTAEAAEASAQRLVLARDGIPEGQPATVVHPPRAQTSPYPWFADYLRRYLVARFGEEAVYQRGLRVETSLDPGMQAKAEAAVAAALDGTEAPLEMAMVVLDPKTGLVRAMVGGRDFAGSQVNLALGGVCPDLVGTPAGTGPLCISGGGSGRQPGSAFKPITLAAAFEKGFSEDRVYSGPGSYTYDDCSGAGCTVRNVESGSYGSIGLREATAYSVNTVYAQLVQDVGVADTAKLAHRLGLTTINPNGLLPGGEPYGPSLTLGAAEVSPLDMAAAYGVFAARGEQFPASPVVKVTDADGKVLEDNTARRGQRVLAGDVADRVNSVLTDVVGYGTGTAAGIERPGGTAGKTGTSEGAGDAWFVGYTPSLVASVWMGYSDSRKPLVGVKGLPQVYGGTIPAQAWHDFMASALDGTPIQLFSPAPAPRTVAPARPPPTAPPATVPASAPPVSDVPLDPLTGLPFPPVIDPPIYEVPATAPLPVPAPAGTCLLCPLQPR